MVDNPPKGQNPPDKQPPPATDPQPSDLAKAIKDRLLSIDPSVALDCANACDVAIGKLLFVKQKFADSAPLPVLGAPGSGKDLRDEVNKRTAAIIEVLDGYVKGTTTLGENFLAAGKAFTTTDNSNADVLKQLDVKKMTTVPKDFGYDPIAYNKPDTKVPDDKPSGGSDPSVRIALEAASHMDWNQLFEVRQILGGSPSASQKVWDTYALWEWGKRSVDTMRRDLSQTLATAIASKWKGDAADAAAKFSKKYADNFGGVAESMENYSKTLKYVSEYLYTTHEAMPPVDEATARTGTGSTYSYTAASAAGGPGVTTYTNRYNVECDLPKFQKNFQEHYLDGLTNTKPGLVQFTPPSNTGPGPGPGNTTDAPPPNDGTQTGPGPGTSDLDKYKDDLQKLLSGPGPGLGELGGPGGPGGLSAPNVDVPPPPSFGSSDAAGPGGSSVPDIGVPDGPGIGGDRRCRMCRSPICLAWTEIRRTRHCPAVRAPVPMAGERPVDRIWRAARRRRRHRERRRSVRCRRRTRCAPRSWPRGTIWRKPLGDYLVSR
ncbi:hypothetical protein [Nocardia arthritidis]|uniref:PPE domain-containing protein n=1 Tax=Nocardia arthritidis TaxID=228602 RepID=A0A6G9Y781_9NOCA|nr:hypothetical protein [Nocardia arthritidis]QIS08970.1 hypothetical protein F5544_05290 [Nocardia arthritidis]